MKNAEEFDAEYAKRLELAEKDEQIAKELQGKVMQETLDIKHSKKEPRFID